MIEKIKPVSNPLTIIAIFAGLAEIGGTIVLPLLEKDIQSIYVWFLMGFPICLVLVFFWTLYNNHSVLYAPSDFKDDKHFMQLLDEKLDVVSDKVKEEFENKLDAITQAQSLVRRGMDSLKSEEFMHASELFKDALKAYPDDADAKVGLANALNYMDEKNHSYPVQLITEALTLNKDNAWALYNRACIKALNHKNYSIASIVEDLEAAMSLNQIYREQAQTDPDFKAIKEVAEFNVCLTNQVRKTP
ncbi:TPR end-of-group domain-containing protein [Planctobacterium marinum]|uniref:TPR end-of-group domain-containing protein n=1 Tax=Planctobacterium marinum TaxID=1631968 RepID=UPI001E5FCAE6|nr:hypothetical protein [Planctobacterium marinum]MCC2605792.1 hypothetical protein [Planctobacterium marinum]